MKSTHVIAMLIAIFVFSFFILSCNGSDGGSDSSADDDNSVDDDAVSDDNDDDDTPALECESNDDCPDDGLSCNGLELCDDNLNVCVHEFDAENRRCSDDADLCNGDEFCTEDSDLSQGYLCDSTVDPCKAEFGPETTCVPDGDSYECVYDNYNPGDSPDYTNELATSHPLSQIPAYKRAPGEDETSFTDTFLRMEELAFFSFAAEYDYYVIDDATTGFPASEDWSGTEHIPYEELTYFPGLLFSNDIWGAKAGDTDGDGEDELIWAATGQSSPVDEVVLAFATGYGFDLEGLVTISAPTGYLSLRMLDMDTGDVDGDGIDEVVVSIIWNKDSECVCNDRCDNAWQLVLIEHDPEAADHYVQSNSHLDEGYNAYQQFSYLQIAVGNFFDTDGKERKELALVISSLISADGEYYEGITALNTYHFDRTEVSFIDGVRTEFGNTTVDTPLSWAWEYDLLAANTNRGFHDPESDIRHANQLDEIVIVWDSSPFPSYHGTEEDLFLAAYQMGGANALRLVETEVLNLPTSPYGEDDDVWAFSERHHNCAEAGFNTWDTNLRFKTVQAVAGHFKKTEQGQIIDGYDELMIRWEYFDDNYIFGAAVGALMYLENLNGISNDNDIKDQKVTAECSEDIAAVWQLWRGVSAISSVDSDGDNSDEVYLIKGHYAPISLFCPYRQNETVEQYNVTEEGVLRETTDGVSLGSGILHMCKQPFVVAGDFDGDSIKVRFNGRVEEHITEPIVRIVLAGPPVKNGIGQRSDVSFTGYGSEFVAGGGSENETAWSVGGSISITSGVNVFGKTLFKSTQEYSYSHEWAEINGSNTSVTYGISRKGGCRPEGCLDNYVLFDGFVWQSYYYDILSHPNNDVIGTEMSIDIWSGKKNYFWTIDYYNQFIADSDFEIPADIFMHTPGDPSTYPTIEDKEIVMADVSNSGFESEMITVAQTYGVTQADIIFSDSTTAGKRTTNSGSVSQSFAIGGPFLEASATIEGGRSFTDVSTTTTGNSFAISGMVGDIPPESLTKWKYEWGLFTYIYGDYEECTQEELDTFPDMCVEGGPDFPGRYFKEVDGQAHFRVINYCVDPGSLGLGYSEGE